jgi:hypothetical protein
MLAAALQYAGIGAVFAMAAAITLLAGVCQRWIVPVQLR